MFLFSRHPLWGKKIHAPDDPGEDERLSMGSKALFIEHPTDSSNNINIKQVTNWELPWADTSKIPYTISGPHLTPLFKRAFVDSLHQPEKRPTAADWEMALVKTIDLLIPCQNPSCAQKWYVFDSTSKPICPFCGTPFKGKLPILNLYSSRTAESYRPDNHRLMVYTNQSLYLWHIDRNIFPNQKLSPEQKKRVGYFIFHNDIWWLVNENIPDLFDVDKKTEISKGNKIELKDGLKLLLSRESGGRLAIVQMVICT
jgi:hypothetical protein